MDIAPLIPLLANIKIPALKMLQKFAEKNNRFKGQLIQLYPIENMAKLVMQHNNGLVHSEINQGQLQFNQEDYVKQYNESCKFMETTANISNAEEIAEARDAFMLYGSLLLVLVSAACAQGQLEAFYQADPKLFITGVGGFFSWLGYKYVKHFIDSNQRQNEFKNLQNDYLATFQVPANPSENEVVEDNEIHEENVIPELN